MNLDDLVAATLQNMDMETDEETRAKFFPQIAAYINEGYVKLSRERFPAYDTVTLTADRNKLLFSDFPRPVVEVVRALNAAGMEVRFCVYPDCMLILGSPGYEYEVTYATLPLPLTAGDDIPALPYYAHMSLANYAAYRMLMSGGRESRSKAQAMYAQYLTEKSDFGALGVILAGKY